MDERMPDTPQRRSFLDLTDQRFMIFLSISLYLAGCTTAFEVGLPDWLIGLDLVLGAFGSTALVFNASYPRAAPVFCLCMAAVSSVTLPALWVLLLIVALRSPRRVAAWLIVVGVLVNTVQGYVFVRFAGPESMHRALIESVAFGLTTIGSLVAGMVSRHARARYEGSLDAFEFALIESALADERERVRVELHDNLGHHLALLGLYSASLAHYDELSAAEAEELTGAIQTQIRGSIDALTASVAHDRDVAIHDPVQSMRRIVADIEAAGVKVVTMIDGPLSALPSNSLALVVRFVREGLTNALKYAGPGSVTVSVTVTANATSCSVRAPAPAAPVVGGAGTGILSLETAAEELGGWARFSTVRDATILRLQLPTRLRSPSR